MIMQVVVTCRSPATKFIELVRQRQKEVEIPHVYKVDAEGLELQVRQYDPKLLLITTALDVCMLAKCILGIILCKPIGFFDAG